MRFEVPLPDRGIWSQFPDAISTRFESLPLQPAPGCSQHLRIRNNRVNLQSDRHRQWDKGLAVEFQ